MLSKIVVLIVLILSPVYVISQQYSAKGQVVDSQSKRPLSGASVMVIQENTGVQIGQSSGDYGIFETKKIPAGNYEMIVSFLGYENYHCKFSITNKTLLLGRIELTLKDVKLDEVKVNGMMIRQDQRGDTTIYNADAFKVNPDATTEDLIKKMPGITVEGSTIKAGGEQVKKVLVDGKEFFGNDPMMALKNIQADMVDKIEVFDKQSDQAQFTGFYDGNEERTINVATKRGKANGRFGRIYGGYGNDNRYESGGNVNYFNGVRRVSVVGLFNNINQQNFSMEDITGSLSGQNQRHGKGEGTSGGMMSESMGGISKTNAIGINYSDLWSKKIEVTTSYFFNDSRTENNTNSIRDYFPTSDGLRVYDELYTSESRNYNHRFNMRLIYSIDSLNSIIFTPRLNWQDNKSNSATIGNDFYDLVQVINTKSLNDSKSHGFAINGDLMYRHKFMKDRRTISLRVGSSSTFTNGEANTYSLSDYVNQQDDDLLNNQFADNVSKSLGINTDIVYTEPISPRSMVMINYSPSITKSEGDKVVFDKTLEGNAANLPIALLSNNTTSDYLQQRGGLSYNYSSLNFYIVASVNMQNSELDGIQEYPQSVETNKSYNSILPSLMIRYRKDRTANLRMFYRTNTSSPSISQLQDVVDNSNTRVYSSGNADLKQQYSHNLMFHFNKINIENSRTLFIMGGITATSDYVATSSVFASQDSIVANGITLPKGTQFNKPVNLNGYYSLRSSVTYGFPLALIKSNININASANYQTKPGMFNYTETTSDTYTFNGGIMVGSSISSELDYTIKYNAAYNIIESSSSAIENYNYFNHTTQLDINWIFLKRLVFNNSLRHLYYNGLGEDYDQNFFLWNAGLGVKFLKDNRAEFRLKVYDLLNQNKNLSRNLTEAYVETSNTNVLTRYAMLTFTYRLKGKGNQPKFNEHKQYGPPQGGFRGGEEAPPPPPSGNM